MPLETKVGFRDVLETKETLAGILIVNVAADLMLDAGELDFAIGIVVPEPPALLHAVLLSATTAASIKRIVFCMIADHFHKKIERWL